MSWMAKLHQTYEQGMQLDIDDSSKPMPISHTVQNAHINIVLDGDGNFKCARVLEKTQIVLPATEKSAGRSSGEAPHPLADKIQYVAGDYAQYGGKKAAYFTSYARQLRQWCESPHAHAHAIAVLQYIEKSSVVKDLVENEILRLDENDQLLTSWPGDNADAIAQLFKVLPKEQGQLDQGNALVCWSVWIPGEPNSDTWSNQAVQQSWIDYDSQAQGKVGLCMVSGEQQALAASHPAKLRHSGDKAKLISSNDLSGFTFRGRFTDSKKSIEKSGIQAAGIGAVTSQKAHNALRWLIDRQQGLRNGDQVIVTWAVSGKDVPQPLVDTRSYDADDFEEFEPEEEDQGARPGVDYTRDLGQRFAERLILYMRGYRQQLEPSESVVIMVIDSATPGRMGITYYRDFCAEEYIDRISQWHLQFAWWQRLTKQVSASGGKTKPVVTWAPGAPSAAAILNTAYGDIVKSNETLKKNLYERLMPCIAEGVNVPRDIVDRSVARASNPNSLEYWEWEKNLGVACALYRGFYARHPDQNKRRNLPMSLDANNTSRDYLYGRLLAVAEKIEQKALWIAGVNRPTTASRLMQRFSDRPYSTWLTIYKQIQPYMQQLQTSRKYFLDERKKDLDHITNQFTREDFTNDKALSGEFLLGFHCQRLELDEKHNTSDEIKEGENA